MSIRTESKNKDKQNPVYEDKVQKIRRKHNPVCKDKFKKEEVKINKDTQNSVY